MLAGAILSVGSTWWIRPDSSLPLVGRAGEGGLKDSDTSPLPNPPHRGEGNPYDEISTPFQAVASW